YEAAGLKSEFASYALRSLLSEGRLRYVTVEKTRDGRLRQRVIEQEGPTALLLTTTAIQLHPENETRLFSIPVSDTPDQTKAVILQAARRSTRPAVDLTAWVDFQLWIGVAEHRVHIPYAERLAELIPPVSVRLRRDVPALLSLIET